MDFLIKPRLVDNFIKWVNEKCFASRHNRQPEAYGTKFVYISFRAKNTLLNVTVFHLLPSGSIRPVQNIWHLSTDSAGGLTMYLKHEIESVK